MRELQSHSLQSYVFSAEEGGSEEKLRPLKGLFVCLVY